MTKEILFNIESKELRCAFLKNGLLQDLIIERKKERMLTGNIYKGHVTNILHNIQSAFIDINEGENGFIHISDILENTKKFEEIFEMDFDLDYDISTVDTRKRKNQAIEEVMKLNQSVLVQVVKEPIGSKGARLTSNISIAGRYLVLLPNSRHRGVSRKIEERSVRDRLKKVIRSLEMPENIGLICRTSCKHATEEQLLDEAQELLDNWQTVMDKFHKSSGPSLLFEESDLIKRAVTAAIDKRYDRILIDDYPTYQRCRRLNNRYRNEHRLKVEYYRDKIPMYERFNVEKEIEKTLQRKIWLPSGGYLYFDRTEAMYTIDVNSGRSSITEGNVEEALVRINIEAAEEISRQLRLRNIGGLIICDFIDMRFRKNQRRVLEKLKEFMKNDTAKCTILGMSDFGLVEMTRQRTRNTLAQTMFTPCPYCVGSGTIKNHETVTIEIERALKKAISIQQQFALRLTTHPDLLKYLEEIDRNYLLKLAEKLNAHLEFTADDTLHLNDFRFSSSINEKPVPV